MTCVYSLPNTEDARERLIYWARSMVRCWVVVAMICSALVCGCRRQQHGLRDMGDVRRQVEYYCSALLLAHDAQQEAQVFRDMRNGFQEISGCVVMEVWVRDRKTGIIYPGSMYRGLRQPLAVLLRFVYLDQADRTGFPLGLALFPPHSIDNLAILTSAPAD